MKLYKVTLEVEMMVLAESETMAEQAVQTEDFDWSDEISQGTCFAQEVTDVKDVPEPNSLPWFAYEAGEDESVRDVTCAQFLKRAQAPGVG